MTTNHYKDADDNGTYRDGDRNSEKRETENQFVR